ncbi:DUF305 domain-containing protein [Candidatus Mycolicibacterium alkanivorans]|uniref:DUF305 domain-containing protein n=1 Tax=Candidatus Mycolicibacterium alkanivorans TaxID=2954114 RepID=A0ABS9YRR9_9MYCO|nr:DUF305 domain-containing protein [Candidatus Mycolicibacterium alkanivorans]MCI4673853.1 DUF305 domain-containing protein [Candidatus Mycolicibacterium alkanivorans]
MTSTSARIVAGLAAFATAVVVSACSKGEDHNAHATSTATGAEQVAAHSAEDVMFAQMMIPHHEQALQLSKLVPDRSTNPAVVKLAVTIADEQQPEINAMKALLLQWDVDPHTMPDHGGMPMQGMVDDATMAKLQRLKGAEFDTLWLQSMIGHHQGAIEMANTEIAKGQSADMITMAKNIVRAQQAEIDQMKQVLGG